MNDPFLGLLLALPVIWLIGIVPPIIEEHVEKKRVEKWRKEYEWITEPLRDEETKE